MNQVASTLCLACVQSLQAQVSCAGERCMQAQPHSNTSSCMQQRLSAQVHLCWIRHLPYYLSPALLMQVHDLKALAYLDLEVGSCIIKATEAAAALTLQHSPTA